MSFLRAEQTAKTVRVVGSAYGAEHAGRGRACESCARGWLGEQGKHRAGTCGGVWWRRSCARTSLSRSSMITNRMYGSMCGSRASEPSSRARLSACTIRARLVGTGVSERGAGWLVVELCACDLPARRTARTPGCLRCMPASTAAQLHALATSCAAVPSSEPASQS